MTDRKHPEPELSRPIQLRHIDARPVLVKPAEAERKALATRFGIPSIPALIAEIALHRDGDKVRALGTMQADIVQSCAVSGEDFPVPISEDITLVFVPASKASPADDDQPIEIELEREELDEIEYEGDTIDIGEAVAQTLSLAIDPYAEGPKADAVRKKAGLIEEGSRGPLAHMLEALKKD